MTKHRIFRHTRKHRSLPLLGSAMILLFVLYMIVSIGQPPKIDSLRQNECCLTLSTVSDFPLTGYTSLSFAEGGGLFRLYDRSRIELLQIGQTYDLTAGHPPSERTSKGGSRTPNYTAIIGMTAEDGTIITTTEDYLAQGDSLLLKLVSGCLLAVILAMLLYGAYLVLRGIVHFVK